MSLNGCSDALARWTRDPSGTTSSAAHSRDFTPPIFGAYHERPRRRCTPREKDSRPRTPARAVGTDARLYLIARGTATLHDQTSTAYP